MNFIPDGYEGLAREIAGGGLISASLQILADAQTANNAQRVKIRIRPVTLKRGLVYQFEKFEGTKAFQSNVPVDRLADELSAIFSRGVTGGEFSLDGKTIRLVSNRRGIVRALRSARATNAGAAKVGESTVEAATSHNRERAYILEEGTPVPFLVDLGVMTETGAVIERRRDKFRQINRFLEFIADVVPELEAALAERTADELTVIDFGCGKSYLTFATYYYLSIVRGLPVRIIGLDLKEDVIAECSRLAGGYGYDGLTFAVGDIAKYAGCDSADLVISLHACDVATDYALERAVRWNARVILSVPCCQHELNAQLGSTPVDPPLPVGPSSDAAAGRAVLSPAFSHGIVRERMAALLTDAMRASLLESAGYRVQILEFIDMSHTPKNLLIRAVKRNAHDGGCAGNDHKPADDYTPNAAYERLRDFLGARPTLERLLGRGEASNG
jgi:hypothetical protein